MSEQPLSACIEELKSTTEATLTRITARLDAMELKLDQIEIPNRPIPSLSNVPLPIPPQPAWESEAVEAELRQFITTCRSLKSQ